MAKEKKLIEEDVEESASSLVINGPDYILTASNGGALMFDLQLLKLKKTGKESFEKEGYGMDLGRCINKILQHRLERPEPYEGLREFYLSYKEEANRLLAEAGLNELFNKIKNK